MRPLEILPGTPLDLIGEGGGEHQGDPVPGHGGVVNTEVDLPLETHVEHPISLRIWRNKTNKHFN